MTVNQAYCNLAAVGSTIACTCVSRLEHFLVSLGIAEEL